MAWFVDETQLTQAIILELIMHLGAGFPEQLSLQAMAKQGAAPAEIGSKLGQAFGKLQMRQNEMQEQRASLEDALAQARRECDLWRNVYDVELFNQFKKVSAELTTAQALVTEQARKIEAANKKIEALENTLAMERQRASEDSLRKQSLIEEQHKAIATQHKKLARLLDND